MKNIIFISIYKLSVFLKKAIIGEKRILTFKSNIILFSIYKYSLYKTLFLIYGFFIYIIFLYLYIFSFTKQIIKKYNF